MINLIGLFHPFGGSKYAEFSLTIKGVEVFRGKVFTREEMDYLILLDQGY